MDGAKRGVTGNKRLFILVHIYAAPAKKTCTPSRKYSPWKVYFRKKVYWLPTEEKSDYPKGVRLSKKQMLPYEACLKRMAGLGKWLVTITAAAAINLIASLNPK